MENNQHQFIYVCKHFIFAQLQKSGDNFVKLFNEQIKKINNYIQCGCAESYQDFIDTMNVIDFLFVWQ